MHYATQSKSCKKRKKSDPVSLNTYRDNFNRGKALIQQGNRGFKRAKFTLMP